MAEIIDLNSHGNSRDGAPPKVDRPVEIERLAALDSIDYETARPEASKRLGIRAHILDREVAKKRRELGLEKVADDAGQGKAVAISDILPWPDLVEGDHVAEAVRATLRRYAVLSDAAADAITLWILLSWSIDNFSIAPRLAITSPTKGCGKTTILRLLNKVTRRPLKSGCITTAALFRAIEQLKPTLILDENEKYLEPGSDLHAILNEGHCRGATVLRVLGENQELRAFDIFGLVAFARNGKIPDDLEQRSIVIEMQRRLPGEPLAELREDRTEPLDNLARMCSRWADDNADIIRDCDPNMVGFINRIADNWRPLFAIADAVGSDWPLRARDAAHALAPTDSDSTDTMLLSDIKSIFDDKKTDRMWSEEIVDTLGKMEGRPWAEFGKTGKSISKHQLAARLRRFKTGADLRIEPRTVWIGGHSKKGYERDQFVASWDRYLAREPLDPPSRPSDRQNPDEMGTSDAFQTVRAKIDLTVQKCQKPLSNGHSDNLTVQNPEKAGNGARGSACDQCGQPGDLYPVAYGEFSGEVHLTCRDEWVAAREDLGIPDFLRRQPAE